MVYKKFVVRLIVVLCLFAGPANAFTPGIQLRDSAGSSVTAASVLPELKIGKSKPGYHFTSRSLVLPGTLVGVGAICMATADFKPVNLEAKELMCANPGPRKYYFDNYTVFLPVAAVYGLNLAGIRGMHNFKDRTMILLMSSTICNTLVFSTKYVTSQTRPDASDNYSFPSGHTAMAFANAEFMRIEYKDVSGWYGAAGYAAAVGTGMLRMYHNKHWLTDVVAGAGVGIASTRLAYWLYPKVASLIGGGSGREHRVHAMVMPLVQDKTYGLSLALRF